MNDAGVAPPGVIPIQQPIAQLRSDVIQYLGNLAQVSNTTFKLSLAGLPVKDRPCSIDNRISPMPNRPITAIRKSKPRNSSMKPKFRRSWPVTVSMPTAASAKPTIIDVSVFHGDPLPMPIKLQKVSK